jgi:hypothetical protein
MSKYKVIMKKDKLNPEKLILDIYKDIDYSKIRCKYYPHCKNPNCPFFHPVDIHSNSKISCKYFPCKNPKCQFSHTEKNFFYNILSKTEIEKEISSEWDELEKLVFDYISSSRTHSEEEPNEENLSNDFYSALEKTLPDFSSIFSDIAQTKSFNTDIFTHPKKIYLSDKAAP